MAQPMQHGHASMDMHMDMAWRDMCMGAWCMGMDMCVSMCMPEHERAHVMDA